MQINQNSSKNEIKEIIDKLYPYRIETHAHTTPVSGCSQITPEEMIKTYKSIGYDAVTISNHFINYSFEGMTKSDAVDYYMKDYEECVRFGNEYGLKVYLAAEIRFNNINNNDYLLYGCDRSVIAAAYDYLDLDIESFRRDLKLENSVFIQAHPFRNGIEPVNTDLLDGIETFNLHPGHNSRIGFAVRYAKENNLSIVTGGSDFHHPNLGHEGVGGIRTKVLPEDSFELAAVLKSGDYLIEVGGSALVL